MQHRGKEPNTEYWHFIKQLKNWWNEKWWNSWNLQSTPLSGERCSSTLIIIVLVLPPLLFCVPRDRTRDICMYYPVICQCIKWFSYRECNYAYHYFCRIQPCPKKINSSEECNKPNLSRKIKKMKTIKWAQALKTIWN